MDTSTVLQYRYKILKGTSTSESLTGLACTMRRRYRTSTRPSMIKYKTSTQYKQYCNILLNLALRRRLMRFCQKHATTTQAKPNKYKYAPSKKSFRLYYLYNYIGAMSIEETSYGMTKGMEAKKESKKARKKEKS